MRVIDQDEALDLKHYEASDFRKVLIIEWNRSIIEVDEKGAKQLIEVLKEFVNDSSVS